MSKRDDDSQADMEVGMTSAERRRRRRRGGGLRVPSDNVPRRTTPPVVPPVPEDPSLAMSIAYSFSNDGSEPVPRVTMDPGSQPVKKYGEPIAPEIGIADVSQPEGNETNTMVFTVTISAAPDSPVLVPFTTQDDSAIAGEDYTAQTGTLTFAAGSTQSQRCSLSCSSPT